jgi:hypothetical protein
MEMLLIPLTTEQEATANIEMTKTEENPTETEIEIEIATDTEKRIGTELEIATETVNETGSEIMNAKRRKKKGTARDPDTIETTMMETMTTNGDIDLNTTKRSMQKISKSTVDPTLTDQAKSRPQSPRRQLQEKRRRTPIRSNEKRDSVKEC